MGMAQSAFVLVFLDIGTAVFDAPAFEDRRELVDSKQAPDEGGEISRRFDCVGEDRMHVNATGHGVLHGRCQETIADLRRHELQKTAGQNQAVIPVKGELFEIPTQVSMGRASSCARRSSFRTPAEDLSNALT